MQVRPTDAAADDADYRYIGRKGGLGSALDA
jgi:hypothetical protein